ncbi:MAG: hypothetical protein ACREQ5_36500 [Candidatus Dormibacteria bacterium]
MPQQPVSHRTAPAVVDFVPIHGATHINDELAAMLNRAGHFTGAGRPFDRIALVNLRSYHHIAPVGVLANGETTVAGIARPLGVSDSAIYDWIKSGWLAARRGPGGRICVPFDVDIDKAPSAHRHVGSHHPPRDHGDARRHRAQLHRLATAQHRGALQRPRRRLLRAPTRSRHRGN